MPLFSIQGNKLTRVGQTNFQSEKVLQTAIEKNLETAFNCRFVATEFSTGSIHAGRIDSLALSEENNPVIIEYKKVESSDLINQSLFYLAWINDHKGDFEVAVQNQLGRDVKVDWSDVRVICIAPNFKKYDLHAVQVMGANIELWSYRLFENNTVYFEEVFQKSVGVTPTVSAEGKNPKMVAAGKKAAETRKNSVYKIDDHLRGRSQAIKDLALMVNDLVLDLDPAFERVPKKLYVAYKISQNVVCMEIQKSKILLFVKLDPKKHKGPKGLSRDVSKIGHYGTGDLEITVKSEDDVHLAMQSIELAYQKIGG